MNTKINNTTNKALRLSSEEAIQDEYSILNFCNLSTPRSSSIAKNKKEEFIAFINAAIDALDN